MNATLREQAEAAYDAALAQRKQNEERANAQWEHDMRLKRRDVLAAALANTSILPHDAHYEVTYQGVQALTEYDGLLLGNNDTMKNSVGVFMRCPDCFEPIMLGGATDLISVGYAMSRADPALSLHYSNRCEVEYQRRAEEYRLDREERKAAGNNYTPEQQQAPTAEEQAQQALERIARALENIADHLDR